MYAGKLEPRRADILEAVRRLGVDDDDIAGIGVERFVADREARLAGADDPHFCVGVRVECRPLAGFAVDQEDRDGCAEISAFKEDGAIGELVLIFARDDVEHDLDN